jgi:hypothetical protein
MRVTAPQFGIELESNLVVPGRFNKDDDVEFDKDLVLPKWLLKGEHCGSELVSPILTGWRGIREVKRQLELIWSAYDEIGFWECGLHIHVDLARNYNLGMLKRLLVLLYRFEPLILEMMPPTRKENEYAQPLAIPNERTIERAKSLYELEKSQENNRFFGLNLLSFRRHGTIEFRYFPGTFDWNTVWPLLQLCLRIVSFCATSWPIPGFDKSNPKESMDRLLNCLGFKSYQTSKRLIRLHKQNKDLQPIVSSSLPMDSPIVIEKKHVRHIRSGKS